jgi:hypothetical protein
MGWNFFFLFQIQKEVYKKPGNQNSSSNPFKTDNYLFLLS